MLRFEVTILGAGSASPTLSRNPSSQLLNLSESYFLIDCGEGTQIQLRKNKLSWAKIDHIFISHLHGDHYLGLLGLLQSMHLLGRKKTLHLYCFPELKEIIDIQNKYSSTLLNYEIKYHFLSDKSLDKIAETNHVTIYSFPLNHRIPCVGFLFKEKEGARKIIKENLVKYNVSTSEIHKLRKGINATNEKGNEISFELLTESSYQPRSYAYCSDTKYDEAIINYINEVDVLYHESTFLNDFKDRAAATYHSTAEQAALIAKKANVKKLILGHYSARYNSLELFLNEAGKVFSNVFLAKEGIIYKI
jgi:ribonuclease Z